MLQGWNKTPERMKYGSAEHRLIIQMRYNVHVTAAFKNHHNTLEIVRLLFDDQGRIKSFNKFKNDALPVMEKFNKAYLEAEYYTAFGTARMASKWHGFVEKGGYLKYHTQRDDRVRPQHLALEGTTLPVEDGFWSTYYPPNGWRCRCFVTWAGTEADTVAPRELPELKPGFNENAGKTGNVFTDSLPYFTVEGQFLEKAEKLFGYKPPVDPEKFLANVERFDRYNNDKNFKLDSTDNLTGGFVFRHKGTPKSDLNENIIASRILSKHGNGVAVLDASTIPGTKNPDIELNGEKAEVKTNKTATINAVDRALRRGAKQAGTVVVNVTSSMSTKELREAIHKRILRSTIERVIVIRNNQVFELEREQILTKQFFFK